jgi:hypothetical protein
LHDCIEKPFTTKSPSEKFEPHLGNSLVKEALEKIAEKFASPEHAGPKQAGDFDDINDPEEQAPGITQYLSSTS